MPGTFSVRAKDALRGKPLSDARRSILDREESLKAKLIMVIEEQAAGRYVPPQAVERLLRMAGIMEHAISDHNAEGLFGDRQREKVPLADHQLPSLHRRGVTTGIRVDSPGTVGRDHFGAKRKPRPRAELENRLAGEIGETSQRSKSDQWPLVRAIDPSIRQISDHCFIRLFRRRHQVVFELPSKAWAISLAKPGTSAAARAPGSRRADLPDARPISGAPAVG